MSSWAWSFFSILELSSVALDYSLKRRNLLPVDYFKTQSVARKKKNMRKIKLEQVAHVLRRKVVELQTEIGAVFIADADVQVIQQILRPESENE